MDEGRYTDEELGMRQTPLSGVFSIEQASADRKGLQQAVDRIVAIIQASPDKERIDSIITRWLKRYLQRLGVKDKALLPYDYLQYVFATLPTLHDAELSTLLPWQWKEALPV